MCLTEFDEKKYEDVLTGERINNYKQAETTERFLPYFLICPVYICLYTTWSLHVTRILY